MGVRKSWCFGLLLAFLCIGLGKLSAQVGNNLILLSNWDNNNLPNNYNLVYNEVFGWHDGNGHEYAILGSHAWTHFIDVTNPSTPIVRDSVAGTFNQCIHRDFKTYGHYCYGVADEGNSTLQIFDLSYLPDSVHMVYNSSQFFERAHNCFIDTVSGRLYIVGSNTQNGGVIVLNIATNPEVPTLLASINNQSYTHDLYVRNDTAYLNNGWDGFRIMDFTIPTAPVMLATLPSYPQQGYNHSCWMDEEGEYLVMCDETRNKSCKVVDVRNLGNVNVASMFRSALLFPDTTSIPHNPLVVGDYVAVAYYHDGVQIWDISNRTAPVHVAGYDTQPNNTTYNDWYGAWGTYPFLPSGTVLGSDVHNGLFVFRVPFPFPRPITATINTTPSTCSTTANGHGQIIPNGGTGPYTYQWSSGQTTAYVTNLLPGTYTVTISDRYGYNIVETVTIPGPAPILVTVQVAAESCNGTGDGAIDLHTSGGTPGYSFLWSTGDMVEDLNGLTAGLYSVTITDTLGCTTTQNVNVSYLQPSPPAFAGNDTTLCSRNLLLSAQPPTVGVGHWAWVSGSGNIVNPNLPSTLLANLQQGLNQLAWIVFNGQCSGIDTLEVYVSSTAFIHAGNDTVVCGPTLQLSGSSPGGGQGMWTSQPATVAFNNANDPNTLAAGLQPAQYTLFWSVSEGNCQAIDSISVFVSRLPFAVFSFVPTGLSVSFSDMSQFATSWTWTFGDGGTSTQQNPVHLYSQPGVYNVCLIVSDTCGADTTCQAVTVGTVATSGPEPLRVEAWPNPFGAWLGISATAPTDSPLSIQILDLQGRAVWKSSLPLHQGTNEFRLELPNLAAGMYILDLQADNWSRKIPLVREN